MRVSKLNNPNELYLEWLSGNSTRKLGRKYGVTHAVVLKYLAKHIGKGCTSSDASLARSVIADYGSQPKEFTQAMLTVPGKFYSSSTMQAYSNNSGTLLDDHYDYSVPTDEADSLSLPYFLLLVTNICNTLAEYTIKE